MPQFFARLDFVCSGVLSCGQGTHATSTPRPNCFHCVLLTSPLTYRYKPNTPDRSHCVLPSTPNRTTNGLDTDCQASHYREG